MYFFNTIFMTTPCLFIFYLSRCKCGVLGVFIVFIYSRVVTTDFTFPQVSSLWFMFQKLVPEFASSHVLLIGLSQKPSGLRGGQLEFILSQVHRVQLRTHTHTWREK